MSEKNKTVVVYRSKTGYTKKYADWLKEELHCDLLEGNKTKATDLLSYDTIIYGGGIYASQINGVKLITGQMEQLKGKKIIILAVGSAPVKDDTASEILKANIPEEFRDKVKVFCLRGGFDYSKLSFGNKLLMNMIKPMMKKEKQAHPDQENLIDAFYKPQDFTTRENLKPVLESIGM